MEFREGWGGLRKIPFHGAGMDIFWNYTIPDQPIIFVLYSYILMYIMCLNISINI